MLKDLSAVGDDLLALANDQTSRPNVPGTQFAFLWVLFHPSYCQVELMLTTSTPASGVATQNPKLWEEPREAWPAA